MSREDFIGGAAPKVMCARCKKREERGKITFADSERKVDVPVCGPCCVDAMGFVHRWDFEDDPKNPL